MSLIYEPKGKAREYAPLALNIYRGCSHGCKYCYAPSCLRMKKENYHAFAEPRKNLISGLKKEIGRHSHNNDEVLLSFTSDPYQPAEKDFRITRHVLGLLQENDVKYTVLTKGGRLAIRDFDILEKSRARFGTTLIFTDDETRKEWEPRAAPISERVEAITEAQNRGIPTWISLEPVVDTAQALNTIRNLHSIVDFWKVGKLNYVANTIDWQRFYNDVVDLLESLGADYYIKQDLLRFAPEKTA